jgi:4-diphosphocytidyl-2-C-methyl-D-erythritol kinase
MRLKSSGKVTLYHALMPPRRGGFWNISSVALPIALADILTVELVEEPGIFIRCTHPDVPEDRDNLCWAAAEFALRCAENYKGGVLISIQKKIPPSSGLGGGSSNVVGVLRALNILLKLNWSISKLARGALAISRDSYFLSYGLPALVRGTGDIVTPILIDPRLRILVVDPGVPFIPQKARRIMERVGNLSKLRHVGNDFLVSLAQGDAAQVRNQLFSFLTPRLAPEYLQAFRLQGLLRREIGIPFVFSGSGPFLVTVVEEAELAHAISGCMERGATPIVGSPGKEEPGSTFVGGH